MALAIRYPSLDATNPALKSDVRTRNWAEADQFSVG